MKIIYRNNETESWQEINKSKYKDETHLQEILYNDPNLIPTDDLRGDHKPLRVVIREFGLSGSGSSDIVGIDENGGIYIIETKLATNPEVKRQVIGQILEYAAFLWKTTYEDFNKVVVKKLGGHLPDLMREKIDNDEWDEEVFRHKIEDSLEKGKFTLFIVVDEMNDELSRILEFLNSREMSSLEIYALSMEYFEKDGKEILVPYVFGRNPVSSQHGLRKPGGWTWEELISKCKENLDESQVKVIEELYNFGKENFDITFGTGMSGSFTAKIVHHSRDISLFTVKANGRVEIPLGFFYIRTMDSLPQDYPMSADDLKNIGKNYENRLNNIKGIALKEGQRWPSFDLKVLAEKTNLEEFKETVKIVVNELKAK